MSEDHLRIGLVAPVAAAVTREATGSIESLMWRLCEGLVDRGHEVTLFATGNSRTRAKLAGDRLRRGYDEVQAGPWEWQLAESLHVSDAFALAAGAGLDVLHCHTPYGLAFAGAANVPTIFTHHVELSPEISDAHRRLPEVTVVCPSAHQALGLVPDGPDVAVIPHGVQVDAFPFGPQGGDYLLFVGRMIDDKDPLAAVRIARRAGRPLVLAGPSEEGFDEQVLPHVDGERVRYLGPVEPAERDRLLAGAAALLFPLRYPEPFGLVMVEALACGTPVLALAVGAAGEIVEPARTGYLADSPDALADLVPAAAALDRAAIRARARERFDLSLMIDRHEALYRRVAARVGVA